MLLGNSQLAQYIPADHPVGGGGECNERNGRKLFPQNIQFQIVGTKIMTPR